MSTLELVRFSRTLLALVSAPCLPACGGNSLDLDQKGAMNGNQEYIFFQPKDAVFSLQVDTERLYWTSGPNFNPTALRGCIKAECDDTVITYDARNERNTQPMVGPFTVDAGMLYWSPVQHEETLGLGPVASCPVSGCVGTPVVVVPEVYNAGWLLVRGGTIYWYSDTDRAVLSCPLVGCSTPKVLIGTQRLVGLAASANRLYWTDRDRVMSLAFDGSAAPSVFVTEQEAVSSLASSPTHLVWVTATGSIAMCPLTGCEGAPTVLAKNDKQMSSLVVDSRRAYWITSDPPSITPQLNASIRAVDLAEGSMPFEVYRGESATAFGPVALALDSEYLYWAGWGSGLDASAAAKHSAIYRMPR